MTLRAAAPAARFLRFSFDFENFIRTVCDRKLYGKCGLNWETEASTAIISHHHQVDSDVTIRDDTAARFIKILCYMSQAVGTEI